MGRKDESGVVRDIVSTIMYRLVGLGSFTSYDVQEQALRVDPSLLAASVDREKRRWNETHGHPAIYNHSKRQYETAPSEGWKQGGLFDQ